MAPPEDEYQCEHCGDYFEADEECSLCVRCELAERSADEDS